MKFMMGHWLCKPHITPLYAVEWYRTTREGNSLKLLVPTRQVHGRADTMVAALTVRLFTPMPDVIGITVSHHSGAKVKEPSFNISSSSVDPVICEDEHAILYQSGDMKAIVCKESGQWRIDYVWKDRKLTSTGFRAMAHMTDRSTGGQYLQEGMDCGSFRSSISKPVEKCYMQEALELDVGELVYGLGERFTPFVKNGQSVDIWNGDGGSCSELAYKNIPFYFTNRGYGVFVDDPGDVSFEVGSENVERVQFAVEGESLTYYIIGGDTLLDMLKNYTAMLGRPALPPAWSFGLWLSTSFTTEYDEKTATSFIDGMSVRNIPVSVFHFDCFWMKGFNWCDFTWDEAVFPCPREMLSHYKQKGLHICVWINPYISEHSPLFEEGRNHDYLLKKTDGSVWQTDLWQAGMGIVDFTNPEATRWYQSKLEKLIEDGVDCFKTDFGERIPAAGVCWHDGSDPVRMHNYYTQLYNEAVFSLLEKKNGKGNALVFARSATAGGQKMPVHWGGDNSASYVSMAETLRAGLSLASCGFGFWSHDISGFESTAPADVYKRWCAFGVFSSHSRLHGSSSYRVPWLFDEEACTVLSHFIRLKHRLMPYIYRMAVKAHEEGAPIMRPMVMMYTEDPACGTLDRQYMFGDDLLVAPVFTASGDVDYYLPKGVWTNLLDGRRQEGGIWMHDKCGFDVIPLWVKENTILPMGTEEERPDYDYTKGVELHLFELSEGRHTVQLPSQGGSVSAEITVIREGDQYRTEVAGDADYRLILH